MIKQLSRNAAAAALALLVVATLAQYSFTGPLVPSALAVEGPTVRQGMFYDKPNDGTSTSTAAKRGSWFVLTRGNLWRNELRSNGYSGPIMQYLMGMEVEGPGPYKNSSSSCDANQTPANNTVGYTKGDFCRYIHPNESWFLHNGRGERLYWRRGSNSVNYQMNPASAGWRQFARSRMASDMSSLSNFDGIFLDNIAMRLYKLQSQNTNSDGKVQEYSGDAAYRSANVGYLQYLNSGLNKQLWANLIDDFGVKHDDYMKYVAHLEGYMNEAWGLGYVGRTFSPDNWLENLRTAESTLSQGKRLQATVQGNRTDYTRQTFGLASYLLVSDGSRATFRYVNYNDGYRPWWQYDNYGVNLGTPKGARYQSGSAWRRDFTCGYVTADPTNRTGKIVQTGCSSGGTNPTATPRPSTAPTPAPTTPSGSGVTLPARIEAERYNNYYDTTSGNQGGQLRQDSVDIETCTDGSGCYAVSRIVQDEWLQYDVNVPQTGDYTIWFRIAANDAGQKVRVEIDGQNVTGTISLPGSGGWNSWASSSGKTVRLSAGAHKLRVVAESGWWNFNYINITR